MTENVHQLAQQLFARSLVEGFLNAEEQGWLDAHLRECAACAGETAFAQELLRAVRNVPVSVPSDLAARTQMRVRLRAQAYREVASSNTLLWIVTAASWLLGVLSAPLVWRVFAWAGSYFDLPKTVLELGFVLWWAVPGLIALAVVLYQRAIKSELGAQNRTRM